MLALNDKGTWLAAGGVTSSGGALGCAVKLHDMTGRQPAVSLGWEDEILLKLQWRGETLLAVTNRGARVISTGGAVLEEARFAEAPTAIAIGASGLYIACGDSREAAGVTVTAYVAEQLLLHYRGGADPPEAVGGGKAPKRQGRHAGAGEG